MNRRMMTILLVAAFVLLSACGLRIDSEAAREATEIIAIPAGQEIAECTPPVTESPTEPVTEPPTEPVAVQITGGYKVLIDSANYTSLFTDNSYWTSRKIIGKRTLSVVSETAFSNIYVEWYEEPEPYSVVWDSGRIDCGANGFLHEYIRLPESVMQVNIEMQTDDVNILCELDIFTTGSTPEGVQDWSQPCDQADVLVFPTHSDDDVLFFGPLIAYYAIERELAVQTAFMVQHNDVPQRNHERLNGLWEMGIRNYPILGRAPDKFMKTLKEALYYYTDSHIDQWQVEQIRRFKPLVVVGHDLKGEYGHGAHMVNAHYLIQAVEYAADPGYFPESAEQYGIWDTPKLYLHLYQENEIILDVNTPLVNDAEGRTPFEIATAAFKYHRSQHQYRFRVQQNGARMYDCRPFGLYRTLVGNDTTADVMENIDLQQWRTGIG